jgi:hypothetical protein
MDIGCETSGCVGRLDLSGAAEVLGRQSFSVRPTCGTCGVTFRVVLEAGRVTTVAPVDRDESV